LNPNCIGNPIHQYLHLLVVEEMFRQISTIVHNFPPEFPETTVERYPNLTLALGDKYPGLRPTTVVDENEMPLQPMSEDLSDYAPLPLEGTSDMHESPWTPSVSFFTKACSVLIIAQISLRFPLAAAMCPQK
jgi:hypothetical protein